MDWVVLTGHLVKGGPSLRPSPEPSVLSPRARWLAQRDEQLPSNTVHLFITAEQTTGNVLLVTEHFL